jgi:hypothetical protein
MSGPRKKKKAAGLSWVHDSNWFEMMEQPFEPDWPAVTSTDQLDSLIDRSSDASVKARALFEEFESTEPGFEAELAFMLGLHCGLIGGRVSTIAALRQLLSEIGKKLGAIEKINEGRSVTDEERRQALALNAQLESDFPVKTPRYREVATRMKIKYDRVRTLIEGPRKAKSKK